MSILDWVLLALGITAVIIFAVVEIKKFIDEKNGNKPKPKRHTDEEDNEEIINATDNE